MDPQPHTILHLALLEKTGTKAQEPEPPWCRTREGLSMESVTNGGLGYCPKPNTLNYHYRQTPYPTRVRTHAFVLSVGKSFQTNELLISHYVTNRVVRDPYAMWCEQLSLSANAGGAVDSIGGSRFLVSN